MVNRNDTQHLDIANIRSEWDLKISDTMCKWLQEKYDLRPSESMGLWSKVYSMIEDEVHKIYRNNIWTDTMENSHGYLYAKTDEGDFRLIGKMVEKNDEIDGSHDSTSTGNDILEKRF